jgi:hypothetical protein
MALREADVITHMRLKQQTIESDHDAIFADGSVVPVLIYETGVQSKHLVETEGRWRRSRSRSPFLTINIVPGWCRSRTLLVPVGAAN